MKLRIYTSFYYLILIACLDGCQPKAAEKGAASQVSSPGLRASGPFLTKDEKGNPVLCWVQAQDTAGENHLLMFARSKDGGQTFGAAQAVPTSRGVQPHDENLSKLLFKKNGDMLAMFAVPNPNPENSYSGLVFYTQSFDQGKKWTKPRQIAQDTINSIDERYFDIALLPNGEVAAIWLDSRKNTPQEGSSLYFSTTQGRQGFTTEKAIDRQLCQCCRTDLFVDSQGRLHAAYRAILQDTIRDMVHLVSADNGLSFSPRERISADNWVINGCPHTGPTMASGQGSVHFAWFTMGGGSGVYYTQKLEGKPFGLRQTVSQQPMAKHPQMTSLSNGKIAIVWDERADNTSEPRSWIGFQVRNADGAVQSHAHLTSNTISATHPVILPVDNSQVVVAYTQRTGKSSEVHYQLVSTEKAGKNVGKP
ncbi:sialidase family protein [Rufibacter sediminis]|uniref:Exo-alpha-sialidase n=1 Tax=Rufibacter sediminis TaxID=2762756 RepID=A0ABR6VZ95_9BACT|nr:sialidase family protein [Rufibacter sediminis]MBC3542229.1 exo-alpha-sialidase [Rufibacter sediminis]